jgi:hypothetical protein
MMPEVCLFLASEEIDKYNYYNQYKLREIVTEWETVTDQELEWLRYNLYCLPNPDPELKYVLVVKDDINVHERVKSIREILDEEKKAEEDRKEKNRIANEKRLATKKKNQEAKERRQLEKLKEKYGE